MFPSTTINLCLTLNTVFLSITLKVFTQVPFFVLYLLKTLLSLTSKKKNRMPIVGAPI